MDKTHAPDDGLPATDIDEWWNGLVEKFGRRNQLPMDHVKFRNIAMAKGFVFKSSVWQIKMAKESLAKLLGSRLGSVLRFSGENTHCSGFRLCVLVLKDRRQVRSRKPRGSTCFPPSVGTPVGD